MQTELYRNFRFNFFVNVADGSFFGLALGLASYQAVIPLFIATLTDSTVLIGLIATVHLIGWQFPQILTSNRVSRLRRYKPMVLLMTIHERWPFLALALVALLLPVLGKNLTLILAFIMVLWQSFGGGFTATAWQSMIGKIMLPQRRGTFYGTQSAAANLLASSGAFIAGLLLGGLTYPGNYAACFFLAGLFMIISMGFLASTREPENEELPETREIVRGEFYRKLRDILNRDANFRWFLLARVLSQFSFAAISFYAIYAQRHFQTTPETIGILTSLMMLGQTFASPFVGWAGDRWGHRRVFIFGNIMMAFSVAIMLFASDASWLYPGFIITGMSTAVFWTTGLAMMVDFGRLEERPFYIGLGNTLIAPATLAAPIIGGWLADYVGFNVTFSVCLVMGLLAAIVLYYFMVDPQTRKRKVAITAA